MDGLLSSDDLMRIRAVVESNTFTFSALVHLAGLDPAEDLRGLTLIGVDFRNSDLRGFDFSYCELLDGLIDDSTIIDSSTLFEKANVTWLKKKKVPLHARMVEISQAVKSDAKIRLIEELVREHGMSAHLDQFLLKLIRDTKSRAVFFCAARYLTGTQSAEKAVVAKRLAYFADLAGRNAGRTSARGQSTIASFIREASESSNEVIAGAVSQFLRDMSAKTKPASLHDFVALLESLDMR